MYIGSMELAGTQHIASSVENPLAMYVLTQSSKFIAT